MIYPERMTPFKAAILIYSQCYHDGDTPLKTSSHITAYPAECSTILDAICEAIDDKTLGWTQPKNCNSGFYHSLNYGARRDCQEITISKTDLKAWLEKNHPDSRPAFLFGLEENSTTKTGDEITKILYPDHAEHAAEKPLFEGPVVTTTPEFLESLPREPEKPLRSMKAIAGYCGVHENTVKDWRKNFKDFPGSPSGSWQVTALPSELNAWMIKKGKK